MKIVVLFCVIYLINIVSGTRYEDYLFEDTPADNTTKPDYLTIDDYCKSVYGPSSFMCRDKYNTGYDYICDSLYCFDPIYMRQCVFSTPPKDKTLCGNGKWCDAHSCQKSASAPATSDACPIGDSVKLDVKYGMNCSQIIDKRPSLCLDPVVNSTWCCESCMNRNVSDASTFTGPAVSANDDCKMVFGNSSSFCQTDSHYNGVFTDICTHMFCQNGVTGACEAIPAADGVPCGNGLWCVNGNCVASADAPVDPKAECFYGNQYEAFCSANIVYPNVAKYCSLYEQGCCDVCFKHKNASYTGCEYGDKTPDVCRQKVKDNTIRSYCHTNQADCCDTCARSKNAGNSECPYGDIDPGKCTSLMNDNIGPGNCYSLTHQKECCETCPKYFNDTIKGCEYGDHWKEYCEMNVKPPKVAATCEKFSSQCCESCGYYLKKGHAGISIVFCRGMENDRLNCVKKDQFNHRSYVVCNTNRKRCKYGDDDPDHCANLMNSTFGTANCYDVVTQTQCCSTCEELKDPSTPNCLYGDKNPSKCTSLIYNATAGGASNCYTFPAKLECCRSCKDVRNDSKPSCEYGDKSPEFCKVNIYSNVTAFLCYLYEDKCCETCPEYKLSEIPDCKYGDKDPTQCEFAIQNEADAVKQCPIRGVDCCGTCSKYGHPGPAGGIPQSMFTG